jgi:hypothetical protein
MKAIVGVSLSILPCKSNEGSNQLQTKVDERLPVCTTEESLTYASPLSSHVHTLYVCLLPYLFYTSFVSIGTTTTSRNLEYNFCVRDGVCVLRKTLYHHVSSATKYTYPSKGRGL